MRPAVCVALCALMVAFNVSCAIFKLKPLQDTVEAPDQVRVSLRAVDGDILSFEVYNLTSDTLVIERDKFELETPKGRIARVPGGIERVYNVPPGGAHEVRVKFALTECATSVPLKVVFDGAFLKRGVPVPIEGLPIACSW